MSKSKNKTHAPQKTQIVSKPQHADEANQDIPKITPSIPKPIPTAKPDEITYCKSTDTPWWKVLLEWTAVGVGIVAIVIYKGQWDAASTANKTSVNNFKAGQRPWVGIEPDPVVITMPSPGKYITWRVFFRNYGNSPALNVRWRTHLFEETTVTTNFHEIQKFIKTMKIPDSPSITLFNGQKLPNAGIGNFPIAEIEHRDIGMMIDQLILGGRVEYLDSFDNQMHTTTFCLIYIPASSDHPESWQGCPTIDTAD